MSPQIFGRGRSPWGLVLAQLVGVLRPGAGCGAHAAAGVPMPAGVACPPVSRLM